MCKFFGVSRAAYYVWVKQIDRTDRDTERKQWIQEAYEKSHQTYGYRRIGMWILKNKGQTINHKAVLRLMNSLQIRSVARKRKIYTRMTELDTYHRYDNVLNRDFTASRPNQKWVTDVTYVHTQQGWAYLSTIKDLFDGFIVAHQIGNENSLALVLNTIKQAKEKEKNFAGVILHSDQGHQYTSHGYHTITNDCAIIPSICFL